MDKLQLEALVYGSYRTFYKKTILYTHAVRWYSRRARAFKTFQIAYFLLAALQVAITDKGSMFIWWLCLMFPIGLILGLDKMRSEFSIERMRKECNMRGADFRDIQEFKSYLRYIELELK